MYANSNSTELNGLYTKLGDFAILRRSMIPKIYLSTHFWRTLSTSTPTSQAAKLHINLASIVLLHTLEKPFSAFCQHCL